jgi:hypothetical protein
LGFSGWASEGSGTGCGSGDPDGRHPGPTGSLSGVHGMATSTGALGVGFGWDLHTGDGDLYYGIAGGR